MQTQQEGKNTRSNLDGLEALLAAFKLMQAAKPLSRSQSELAMAAVLDPNKVVGGNLPQSPSSVYKQGDPRVRASSLPIGIPSHTLATLPENLVHAKPLMRVTGSLTPPSPQLDKPPIKICLYETEMCRGWEATGRCRYGSKCQFAHGPQELQPVQRHPKYKTEICRTFAQTGLCRYGKRCRFIHPETSTDLNLLPDFPLQTDQHSLYQTSSIAQEPCSQQRCSAIASPSIPDSLGYASPQAVAQYSGLHPAAYQDHFLRPVPLSSQSACFQTPPYTTPHSSSAVPITSDARHFQTMPYSASYSSPAVPTTSDTAHLENTPYTSPYSSLSDSVPDGHSDSLLTHMPGPGQMPAVNSGLLGSGHMYSAYEPQGLMLGGTAHGGQLETSPRGVLEFAAMHSCGYSSGLSHAQAGVSKPSGPSLYGSFTTYA